MTQQDDDKTNPIIEVEEFLANDSSNERTYVGVGESTVIGTPRNIEVAADPSDKTVALHTSDFKVIEPTPNLSAEQQKELESKAVLQKMEALQLELQDNPRSLSFVQLADLYLTQNMVDEAFQLVERSLRFNPKSMSGIIILGRIHKIRGQYLQALEFFDLVISKAPTNWHVHLLRADTHLKMQHPKKALADFKKVMFLNPQNLYARKAIAKLEVLTADEYEDDVFEIQSVRTVVQHVDNMNQPVQDSSSQWKPMSTQMERVLSLVDAFTVRHEYERALKLLHECQAEFGDHPEIQTRLLRLSQHESAQKILPKMSPQKSRLRETTILEKKKKALELILSRIKETKHHAY